MLLVGWIVVELVVLREWSWLQPLYAAIGVSLIAGSRSCRRRAPGDAYPLTACQVFASAPRPCSRTSRLSEIVAVRSPPWKYHRVCAA